MLQLMVSHSWIIPIISNYLCFKTKSSTGINLALLYDIFISPCVVVVQPTLVESYEEVKNRLKRDIPKIRPFTINTIFYGNGKRASLLMEVGKHLADLGENILRIDGKPYTYILSLSSLNGISSIDSLQS